MGIWGNPITLGGSGGGGGDVFAFIVATYPASSVCSATNGQMTITATNTSGFFVFKIPTPSSVPETWTISCTDGSKVSSKTVVISTEGQSEVVTLSYELFIIRSGAFDANFAYAVAGYNATVTELYNDTSVRLFTGNVSNSRSMLYFTPKFTFNGNYNYLIIDYQVRGFRSDGIVPCVGVLSNLPSGSGSSFNPTWVTYQNLENQSSNALSTRAALAVDISQISGDYWVGFSVGGSASYSGEVRCFNLYLSSTLPT